MDYIADYIVEQTNMKKMNFYQDLLLYFVEIFYSKEFIQKFSVKVSMLFLSTSGSFTRLLPGHQRQMFQFLQKRWRHSQSTLCFMRTGIFLRDTFPYWIWMYILTNCVGQFILDYFHFITCNIVKSIYPKRLWPQKNIWNEMHALITISWKYYMVTLRCNVDRLF